MNSNMEIVSVTRYFGSIIRKFRGRMLKLPIFGCLFGIYLEELNSSTIG